VVVETNLKSELTSSSTLVAKMVLPETTYTEVATMLVKKASIDLKTTLTKKAKDNHSASPTLAVATLTMLQWI
jgi:hypothetical protein